MQYLRIKDWLVDGAMADASVAVVPTKYPASTFPQRWQHKITVIHEGVPEALLKLPRLQQLTIAEGVTLGPDVPLVTFISRNLEPMRGFPTFMRALPSLLAKHPTVQVVIVGGDEVSYSNAPGDGRTWRELLLEELGGKSGRAFLDVCTMTNCKSFIAGVIYTCIFESICVELEPAGIDGMRYTSIGRVKSNDEELSNLA